MDLVVPVKSLAKAKTRLRGAADHGIGEPGAHARLALALTHDTVAAVLATPAVRNLIVVTSDPVVAAELAALGVEVAPDPLNGLNAAYAHGAAILRARDPGTAVGALQADLPALRSAELEAAIASAMAGFADAPRAFVPDAPGTGTTFLLAAPGTDLDPLFGGASAQRHAASGARLLTGDWPSLRRDVDTSDDLRSAMELGLGAHTRAVLTAAPVADRPG